MARSSDFGNSITLEGIKARSSTKDFLSSGAGTSRTIPNDSLGLYLDINFPKTGHYYEVVHIDTEDEKSEELTIVFGGDLASDVGKPVINAVVRIEWGCSGIMQTAYVDFKRGAVVSVCASSLRVAIANYSSASLALGAFVSKGAYGKSCPTLTKPIIADTGLNILPPAAIGNCLIPPFATRVRTSRGDGNPAQGIMVGPLNLEGRVALAGGAPIQNWIELPGVLGPIVDLIQIAYNIRMTNNDPVNTLGTVTGSLTLLFDIGL